jgi:transposase
MRHTREILRHKWILHLGHRAVRDALGTSHGTITATLKRARRAGLDWPAVKALSDAQLEALLYPPPPSVGTPRPEPDWPRLHLQLRKKGVTLELLHQEHLGEYPDGLRRSAFCAHHREWVKTRGPVMRQTHLGGDKLFVDYAGHKACYTDPLTGKQVDCELFVATLGASNFTYAEASPSQKLPDFLASHARALAFFGGVPCAIVSDQLKSAVSVHCRYEPGMNTAYLDFARHYDTALLPARPRSPKDKAKVEVAVQVAERWLLARLRNVQSFSLAELNAKLRRLLDEMNDRPMRVYHKSRRQLFHELDLPSLRPLPEVPYEYAQWKKARVNIDCHVELGGHYYSAPHSLLQQLVELRYTDSTVEILHEGKRVALHRRGHERGRHTTVAEHLPRGHQEHLKWSAERLLQWARTLGPMTEALCDRILESRAHPEQGYRSCLGLLRLNKRFGKERLEAACQRAMWTGATNYRSVKNILEHNLDREACFDDSQTRAASVPVHENLRGPGYYN